MPIQGPPHNFELEDPGSEIGGVKDRLTATVLCSNEHQTLSRQRGLSDKDSDLTKLRKARTFVHGRLCKLEPLPASYHAKLVDIDARIPAIALNFQFPPRRRMPDPHFARGELPRLPPDIMCDPHGGLASSASLSGGCGLLRPHRDDCSKSVRPSSCSMPVIQHYQC